MKKITALILALSLLLCACGTTPTTTSSDNSSASSDETVTADVVTRVDALGALYEISDKQLKAESLHKFTDVKNTDKYNVIVQWGYDYNIPEKTTTFRPLDPVTQDEFANFVYNFAVNYKGVFKGAYENAAAYCSETGAFTVESGKTLTKEQLETAINNYKSYIAKIENKDAPEYHNIPFDEENVVLSFAALSDLHFRSGTDPVASERFNQAITNAKNLAGGKLDTVLAVGDLVQDFMYENDEKIAAAKQQVGAFKEAASKYIPKDTTFIFSTGNHDRTAKASFEDVFFNAFHTSKEDIDHFYSDDVVEDCEYGLGNRHAVVNGYHFLSVGIYQNHVGYLKPILDKITKEEPLKLVFVMYHFPPKYPVGDLHDFLSNYPQVIFFSGHTHWSTIDDKALRQEKFTYFSTGSVRETEYTGFEEKIVEGEPMFTYNSEGTLVQVDKNGNIRFLSYTNYDGSVIAERVIMGPNKENTHLYTYR
jgi:UDP-2,3-diacylglucosamine pyrophosphatase LpxH